jgi:hypothetical protein
MDEEVIVLLWGYGWAINVRADRLPVRVSCGKVGVCVGTEGQCVSCILSRVQCHGGCAKQVPEDTFAKAQIGYPGCVRAPRYLMNGKGHVSAYAPRESK